MHAIIKARKDDSFETLCFRSKDDAERFQEFVIAYQRESGAGNGYGAYWIFDLEIGFSVKPPDGSVSSLEDARIESMLRGILRARTAVADPDMAIPRTIRSDGNAIVFELGELPPRQRPGKGDMFRTVGSGLNEDEASVDEGRVLNDLGDELEVVSSWDEDRSGTLKPDAKRVRVRTAKVMKIYDWLRGRRG